MANPPVWRNFWTSLKRVITTAWPEIGVPGSPIFRETQSNRQAWRSQMDAGKLRPPWCVVVVPPTQTSDQYGPSNVVFNPRVTVFYIATNDSDPEKDIAGFVTDKLIDLQNVLVAHGWNDPETNDSFQCLEDFTLDVSADNAPNTTFGAGNQPIFGGALSFSVLFGYVAVPVNS